MAKYRTFYNTALWKRTRLQILQRDHYHCTLRLEGCTEVATQVDHIIPANAGGPKYDPANLRAACKHCNVSRANSGRHDAWRYHHTHIILVTGPPGAGKTTYARTHANPNDLILDWDALAEAMRPGESRTGGPDQTPTSVGTGRGDATRLARNSILRALQRAELDVPQAWILSTNPNAETMFPYHDVVTIDPGIEACKARRPHSLHHVIDRWYDRHIPPDTPSRQW